MSRRVVTRATVTSLAACILVSVVACTGISPASEASASTVSRVTRVMPGLESVLNPGSAAARLSAMDTASLLFLDGRQAGDSLGGFDGQSEPARGSADDAGAQHKARIVGSTMLVSGISLCSWGITSWQRSEDQCCPVRNTENVMKIIVGVVLINAGLAYLVGLLP